MQNQYPIPFDEEQAPPYQVADVAQGVGVELATFLYPLLVALDQRLDKRLVRTFLLTIETIITFRDRVHGLLLSELGGYLLIPQQCEAGTKRLSNLIHSPKWVAELISIFLWQRATAFVVRLNGLEEDVLAVWDESVWEKPESQKLEDLGSVRSSKARRLTRIKPGFYHPRHPSDLCARHELVRLSAGRPTSRAGSACAGGHALVDQSRTACHPLTHGGGQIDASLCGLVGAAALAYL
jgi:hypothetical protein